MEEGVEEEVGIGDTNMLEIVLVELVGILCTMLNRNFVYNAESLQSNSSTNSQSLEDA